MSKEKLENAAGEQNSLELFGEVNQHAHVFPLPKAFADVEEAMRINHLGQEEGAEHHAGSNVFVVDLPKGVTQQEYANQLAKVCVITDTQNAKKEAEKKNQDYEYSQEPKKILVLKVEDITSSEENLWTGLKTIARYADENTRGYAFVLDEELNLKDSKGDVLRDSQLEPVIDIAANERLSALRKALASTALITFNVLPVGYELSEPTVDETEQFLGMELKVPNEGHEYETSTHVLEIELATRTPVNKAISMPKERTAPIVRRQQPTVRIPSPSQEGLF